MTGSVGGRCGAIPRTGGVNEGHKSRNEQWYRGVQSIRCVGEKNGFANSKRSLRGEGGVGRGASNERTDVPKSRDARMGAVLAVKNESPVKSFAGP